jgi:hypothetical protein
MHINKLIPYTLIAILLSLTYVATSWGLADLYAGLARYDIKKWQTANKAPDRAQWHKALARLETALRREPGSPQILENMGRLYTWRALVPGSTAGEVTGAQQTAADYYRKSLVQRPTSPYTWANLALTKYSLEETDDEFMHAIRQAVFLGPWEPDVQILVADAGLGAWWKLPAEVQAVVLDNVVRGITWEQIKRTQGSSRHQRELVKIARHHRHLGLLCQQEEVAAHIEKECKKRYGDRR